MFFYAIAAVVAIAALGWYFWQRRARPTPAALKPGQPMPLFIARDETGNKLDSSVLEGSPAVVIFVRGGWCPFCSKQVKDLTAAYKSITELGARLILVTPEPLETTRRVAEFFDVEFDFWLDDGLAIARALDLVHGGGVPSGWKGEYGTDTVWPTSIVVDAAGVIRYTEVSKHIVDRPNPKVLLRALKNAS